MDNFWKCLKLIKQTLKPDDLSDLYIEITDQIKLRKDLLSQ